MRTPPPKVLGELLSQQVDERMRQLADRQRTLDGAERQQLAERLRAERQAAEQTQVLASEEEYWRTEPLQARDLARVDAYRLGARQRANAAQEACRRAEEETERARRLTEEARRTLAEAHVERKALQRTGDRVRQEEQRRVERAQEAEAEDVHRAGAALKSPREKRPG